MVSQRSNIKGERPWKTWLSKRPQGLWFRDGGILGLRAFWRTHKHIMTILLWVLLYPWFPHSTRKKNFSKSLFTLDLLDFLQYWFWYQTFFFPSCSSNQKCVYICTMCTNRWGKIFFTLWSTNLSLERILLFFITAAYLLSAMDRTADPCHDFFQYACGSWNRKHVIPEDRSSISTFEVMADQLQVVLKGVYLYFS